MQDINDKDKYFSKNILEDSLNIKKNISNDLNEKNE